MRNIEPVEPNATKASGGPTFGDVLTEWLDYGRTQQGKRRATRTTDDNRKQVESRIRSALDDIRLGDLTAAHLERQYIEWIERDGLSDNSVHRFAALISSALSFAVRRRYLAASPAAVAVAPAATKSTKKVPTAEEDGKLLAADAEYGRDIGAAINLSALTGARAGESQRSGIHVTIVEPGGFASDWGGASANHAQLLPAYDVVRTERVARTRTMGIPTASARVLLKIVDAEQPPIRVFFGGGSPSLSKLRGRAVSDCLDKVTLRLHTHPGTSRPVRAAPRARGPESGVLLGCRR